MQAQETENTKRVLARKVWPQWRQFVYMWARTCNAGTDKASHRFLDTYSINSSNIVERYERRDEETESNTIKFDNPNEN